MRSLLATYRKLLDDAEAVNSLRDELKWLAGVLGEARDAEVMHARLKDMVAEEPGELVMGPVIRRIDLELGADYQKAHTKVLDALDGRRYFRLLDALESLLAAPPLAPRASKPARKVIPRLVQRDVKRLRTAVREATRHPAGTGDHPALHEARKDGKRLRYAAEAATPVNPKNAGRLADAAHRVQKVLGDHQDSVVTRDLLRRLGAGGLRPGRKRIQLWPAARAGTIHRPGIGSPLSPRVEEIPFRIIEQIGAGGLPLIQHGKRGADGAATVLSAPPIRRAGAHGLTPQV